MIERAVMQALHEAQKGSKQELQANALKAVLEAVKADGFVDPQELKGVSAQTSERRVAPPEKPGQLQEEWNRQAGKLARLFAEELGLNRKDYLASLPQFEPQPETFKGKFDIPVIVETRVPLSRLLEAAGLKKYFDVDKKVKDWEGSGFETTKAPYTTWMQDGRKNLKKSIKVVRSGYDPDERGATAYDGVALYLAKPNILSSHYVDLPGSKVGSDYAPCLGLWDDGPELHCVFVDDASGRFGSVSCGSTK